ncbi:MAG: aminofutalosine synthase MqnE [Helicobacteraceae bacterium]
MSKIIEKIYNGAALSRQDALALYDENLFVLGAIAHKIRTKLNAKRTYFNINRHINPTNECADFCQFCGFSRHRKNPNGYTMSVDEIRRIASEAVARGAGEIHMVSAHRKNVGAAWYFDGFRAVKQAHPHVHLKAMTAAEVDFVSREYGLSYDEVLQEMIKAGVDSMPGGGAEIFDEEIRHKICRGKVSSQNWLKIHKAWHGLGRQSNATMLFGHIESRAHRIDHMFRLQELQAQTHGFNAFIPLVYQRENNYLDVKNFLSAEEILKTFAIARIVLQNIPHIKAYWVTTTVNLALVAQEFGADDIDGTIQKESINSAAGAKSANGLEQEELISLIKNAGFTPTLRDSLYNILKEY